MRVSLTRKLTLPQVVQKSRCTMAETVVIVRQIGSLRAGWVKLGRPTPGLFVLDRIGWQPISQPA
jgi:hypothetical protein